MGISKALTSFIHTHSTPIYSLDTAVMSGISLSVTSEIADRQFCLGRVFQPQTVIITMTARFKNRKQHA